MNIVFAANIFPPEIGGPATYVEALARYMHEKRHTVSLVCFSAYSGIDRSYPFPVHRIGLNQSKLTAHSAYFFKLAALSKKSDIIYAQGPVAGGVQANLLARLRKISYIVKVTGDYAWEQAANDCGLLTSIEDFQKLSRGLPLRIVALRGVQKVVSRNARRVIVPSEYLRDLIRQWGVLKHRAVVIRNAAPIPRQLPQGKEEIRDQLGLSGHIALSVGRLVPWKGFLRLIEAWPLVLQHLSDAKLIIVGSGPDEATLQKAVSDKGLQDSVRLAGRKVPDELALYYKACDIFVLNSGYEGLSHTILEAQAHGIPVAVSNAGGNSEIVRHGINGLLFRNDQTKEIVEVITRLFQSTEDAVQYARTGLQHLHDYTIEKMFEDTVGLFQEIVYRNRVR